MSESVGDPKPICAEIAGSYSMIRIEHPWGWGEWHHPADRDLLQSWCDAMNTQYGAGTHVIKELSDALP